MSTKTPQGKRAGRRARLELAGSKILPANSQGGKLMLRQRLGFTRPQFARLIAISERSLAALEQGKQAGESVSRALAQLDRLVTSLEEVIDANEIGPWMTNPNQAFDGLKPMEVIERGEIDRIWLMIYHLRSGVAF